MSGAAEKICSVFAKPVKFLFGIPGECAFAVICGLTGGFPCGVQISGLLYEKGLCSKEEAERTAAFSNNAGMAYVISGIGAAAGSFEFGMKLYICQTLSACAAGIILNLISKIKNRKKRPEPVPLPVGKDNIKQPVKITSEMISSAVMASLDSSLRSCAFICFFAVIGEMCKNFMSFFGASENVCALVCGLIELSDGITMALRLGGKMRVLICAFILSWSGLCVFMQTSGIAEKYSLDTKIYPYVKFLQAAVCALAASVIM